MTDTYVPFKEATQILGTNRSTFFFHVKKGDIRTEEGRGPRDGRYLLSDIESLKRRREHGRPRKLKKKLAPVLLDWLTPRDIPAILKLDQLVYDEMFLAEMERYQQWSEKNGQLAIAAFDARSNRQEMLAYVAALPLDESVILQVLRGERQETDITKDEIQSYERLGGYVLLANSAVTHHSRPDLLGRVIIRLMDEWVKRYPERFIERIYAQAESERGDLLIQHFFMQPRYDLADNAYMLDFSRPAASKIIRRFQSRLKEKDSK